MEEIYLIVAGLVQGVGFRAAVKRHALCCGIRGYVRNLPDGRVEICAQGEKGQVDEFIRTVRADLGAGSISSIETTRRTIQPPFSSFEVR